MRLEQVAEDHLGREEYRLPLVVRNGKVGVRISHPLSGPVRRFALQVDWLVEDGVDGGGVERHEVFESGEAGCRNFAKGF